ncbi:MAG: hypothetical protein C0606_00340 [Hyphomicrobiales bacterium]|nr:MAG: hypothetical protein C0606_00340 [Hyphomicrobiales bacterium]
MLLQVVFAAEHASAMAVAAGIGGPTGTPIGFLQICTADGIVSLDGDNDRHAPDDDNAPCVLCASAAVSGALDAGNAPALADPAPTCLTVLVPPSADFELAEQHRRAGTTRGPPSA